jgi:uncharacterized protein (TIGR03435 family)
MIFTGSEARLSVNTLKQSLRGLALCATAAIWIATTAIAQSSAQTPPQDPQAQQTAASPNDLSGIWQGTLHSNPDQRLELKITQTGAGQYKLTLFLVDRGGQSFEATKTTFADGTLAFTMGMVGGRYEGRMTPDGKTITGKWTWTQGLAAQPLVLIRTSPEAAWPIPEPVKLMPPDAHPTFEVATIKPSRLNEPGKGFGYSDGVHTTTWHTNGYDLISVAYGLHATQIAGAPDWLGADLYDIDGEADVPGKASNQQIAEMLQGLLADRFALKFHREQRELPVYALQVVAGGARMKESAAGLNDPQKLVMSYSGDFYAGNMTMKQFAGWMQTAVMDKPVIDQTGLTARYDFHLKWTPDDSQFTQFRGTNGPVQPRAGDNSSAPPNLYPALQEQLGLKFTVTKALVDVIVIDHVEKPSAN